MILRITRDGEIILKAQQHRTQELNREDALNRLKALILDAIKVQKTRRPTKTNQSLENKTGCFKKESGSEKSSA